ncbi:hypothetical protein AVEN_80566-1 [Araneus ventricosus]|uniref:Uncharacterized protein n=1 Tax=Araneus ventricosus TaxID=182803 RepID=A0A4Y2CRR6_ARAVE|nr:hypothetical protein AVEN_80566-1 [Araneus ventricosus]
MKLVRLIRSNLDAALLQRDLDYLSEWCTDNKLLRNIEKCRILCCTRNPQLLTYDYKINNLVVSSSNSVIDLGINFDTELYFSWHIDAIVSRAYRRLRILKRKTREFSSALALKVLHYTHVRDSLEYCSNIWDLITEIKLKLSSEFKLTSCDIYFIRKMDFTCRIYLLHV